MAARKTKAEVTALESLLGDIKNESGKSRKMTSEDLFNYVNDNFDSVASKNAMLKKLRGEGLSCSMDRVFTMYLKVGAARQLDGLGVKPEVAPDDK